MLQRSQNKGILGLFMSFLFLAACSTTPPVQEFSSTANPSEEINALQRNIEKAQTDQVNVLSPNNYKKAEKHLREAKEARSANDGNKEILKEVAIGNAWLLKANDTAERGADNIPDIVDMRARALEAKAATHAKDLLNDADHELKKFGKDFEDGDFSVDLEDRKDLLNEYMSVELSAIKGDKLGTASANLSAAEREGAKKVAPKTLALAQKRMKDADLFITSNRQDATGIDRMATLATKESERALRITRESKINKNKTLEQLALEMEAEQSAQRELSGELDSTKSELGATTSALAVVSAESSQLSDQVALDEKLKNAKSQFSTNEAEVFRDGDKLLIRLKGLKFPSGQADLTAASYPLMTKVQSVIKSLGSSEIEVEGHTDALGSKDVNARLSEKRAEAVKNYLVQNSAVNESDVRSSGFADEKPITTNKTPQGRAQNRRVDILISPL
ncbi:MAG: OmpA family protein [Bdellovibrionota bacterium]